MAKPFIVQHVALLSLLTLVIGLGLLGVGLLDVLGYRFTGFGGWGYWMVGIGAVVLLAGLVWFASYRLNVKKFNKLMEEKSKAAFVKKLDDVEFLAWKLPMKYEDELMQKKKGFGMK